MTRYARGNNASKKKPQDGTPWNDMKNDVMQRKGK